MSIECARDLRSHLAQSNLQEKAGNEPDVSCWPLFEKNHRRTRMNTDYGLPFFVAGTKQKASIIGARQDNPEGIKIIQPSVDALRLIAAHRGKLGRCKIRKQKGKGG
jgi:hypothetical protein